MLQVEETYRARQGGEVIPGLVAGELEAATPYTIEIRFLQGLNARQKQAFKTAADRWTRVIVGDIPEAQVERETVDDVVILAQGTAIDGPGRVLGQAGPTVLRPGSQLPAKASCRSTPRIWTRWSGRGL